MNSKHMIRKYKAFLLKRIHISKPSIKYTSTKAIITLFSAPLRFYRSLCKLQYHFPNVLQTPGLGTLRKHLLNRACLEKVCWLVKQLTTYYRSVKVYMVRAILLKEKCPVLSMLGGRLRCHGSSNRSTALCWIERGTGNPIVRFINNGMKDTKFRPKYTHSFYDTRTTVSAKGRNSYAAGGPVLAARWQLQIGWCTVKAVIRRSGPVTHQSRMLNTGTGRATNVLNRLDDLRERAKTTKVIDRNLYKTFILNKDMYLAAYQKLRSNPGMMTPGINPTTLDGISEDTLLNIIHRLSTGEFQFTPGRRITIPKANGGKRPLTIGSPIDKLVQEVMRMVLEAIYEPSFKDTSHGFRPNRSCHTALRTIYTKFVGCTWFIEGDFQKCFDTIPHKKLISVISERIKDQRFIELLIKALNAGYMSSNIKKTDIVGTPQGSIISPILANIYLHSLDEFIETLKGEFEASARKNYHPRTSESLRVKYHIERAKLIECPSDRKRTLRKLITLQRNTPSKKNGEHSRRLMYCRYADDWIIAINGSFTETKNILDKVRTFCSENLGLILSEDKTKITNSYLTKILFLGVDIRHAKHYIYGRGSLGIIKRIRKGLLLTAPISRIKNKLTKAGFIIDNKTHPRINWLPLTPRQIVNMGNQVLRGFWNYYSFVQNKDRFISYTYWIIRDVVAKTLAQKLKLATTAKVYKKFGRDLTIIDLTKRDNNKRPDEMRLVKPDYKINLWDFKTKNPSTIVSALYSVNTSLATLDNLSCALCSSQYRVEMHHIRKMRDLKPKANRVDSLMARANRKQIPLCRECHMKHHGGKIDLSRILPKIIKT